MIVKLQYHGWHYFEGEQIEIVHGQACDTYLNGAIVLMDHDKLMGDLSFAVNVIKVTNGADTKTILIPYNTGRNNFEGYLLNNEGKTIERIN